MSWDGEVVVLAYSEDHDVDHTKFDADDEWHEEGYESGEDGELEVEYGDWAVRQDD